MKLRIGSKMLAGFLAMTALILAGGLVTILYTYRLQDVTAKLLAENVSSLKVAQELEVALFHMRGMTFNYILEEHPRWLTNLEERKKEWQLWIDKAQATARTDEENEILRRIPLLFTEYERDLQAALVLNREGKSSQAKARLLHAGREVFDQIYEECEAFIATNERAINAAQEKITRTNSAVRTAMVGLGIGGVIMGGLLGLVISRSIVNPIYELVLKVRGVTGGEFVERVGVTSDTEIEELDRHVHVLIDRINAAMADLEKSRKLLARTEKLAAIGKVAASVAHEIRNPLTAIKMLIYSIREDLAKDDEKSNDLAVILKEIDRLERFVQNFLQFARPPDPVLAAIDVNATVHETLTLLAPSLRQNGTELQEIYQPGLEKIVADADQLKQVVMNLILNAADSMPKGGRLTAETQCVRTYADNDGKEWVQIRIRDNGRGIPEELLESIFDPFVSGRKNGTGLGLSIAYQILHRHGGWIEAANNEEGGVTFTVSLPAGEVAESEERGAEGVERRAKNGAWAAASAAIRVTLSLRFTNHVLFFAMHKVLIVDDEESVRYSFKKLLREPAYHVLDAKDGSEAIEKVKADSPELVILDIQMPGLSGLEVLQQIKSLAPKTPVLIITAYGSSDRVIAAMRHGAYEYIEKPFDIPRMKALIDEALEVGRLMRAKVLFEAQKPVTDAADRIIGNSQAMREVFKLVGRVAPSDVNVLVLGESGTGKELVARAIYQNSQRAGLPFLAVNCAAIPETLLESELFGYEKGAFTGATKRKIGKFEQADGGTIFLDEIGDMSFSTQAKLLRVLQEGTFERLGGDETLNCNVRLIAATNQNLEKAIAEKKFREDLYYRIKVITISLPPLRQRKEDLQDLIHYFMIKHSAQLKKDVVALAPETMQLLNDYDWPGNVREIENVLKRAILLCKANVITPDIFAGDLRASAKRFEGAASDHLALFLSGDLEQYHGRLYETVIAEVEQELIIAALKKAGGNQVRAAQLLGISRVMLHDRIEKYGIKTEVIVQEA